MAKKAAGEMATSQASGHLFGNMRLQCQRDVTAVTVTSSSVTGYNARSKPDSEFIV
jgi:hypothetical protein